MSYADRLRARATQYAEMAYRQHHVDPDGAAVLGLLAIKTYRSAEAMEA